MENFSLRTLTMKHFSTPQELSFSEINIDELEENYGNYISFYHHHFLKIRPCQENELPSAYKNLRDERSKRGPGIRILQTLTMTGQEGNFWVQEPAFLYISLIQMRGFESDDSVKDRYQSLVDRLHELFESCLPVVPGLSPSFALYYSYDFCDFVLFAKNICLNRYNEILWEMTTGKDHAFRFVRDTYSLYAFHTRTLVKAMHGTVSPELNALSINISLRLSIYSSTSFYEWIEKMNTKGIVFDSAFMFSRFDKELRVSNISGAQLVFLINELDRTYKEKCQPFGSYELMLLSHTPDSVIPSMKKPWRDEEFIEKITPLLKKCDGQVDEILQEYNQEVMRSLQELLLNGFSTEFLLGVLPAYLNSMSILSIPDCEREDWQYAIIRQELSDNAQFLFNALNTLQLSMMHGERLFIQAPAFNASYFDIPPKLFAYYAAILNLAKSVYQEEKARYNFLMVPDFRPGINVLPLPRKDSCNVDKRLAIVYLAESYFYDPIKAIPLIFHETAHYLSARYRKERAEEILFSISAFLLLKLPVSILLTEKRIDAFMNRQSLPGVLAHEMSKMMLQYYNDSDYYDDYIPYSFESLQQYLESISYGFRIFSNSFFKDSLIKTWSDSISSNQNDGLFRDECIQILNSLQKEIGESQFLTQMYPQKLACDILAAKVAKQIDDFSYEMDAEEQERFYQHCNNIPYAFREAFADHRMLQVLGNDYGVEHYEDLLQDTRKNLDDLDFEFSLRHDAILKVHFPSSGTLLVLAPEAAEKSEETQNDWIFYCARLIIISGIVRYLNQCQPDTLSSEIISDIKEHLYDKVGNIQIRHIHCVLNKYREDLMKNEESTA